MNQEFNFKDIKNNLRYDLISGLVVFLVAIPLCLGIALASGAPLFSGLIAGVVGGIIVTIFSGSQTSVSGPAAGLALIVMSAITTLGHFETFLLALVIAGAIQLFMGILRIGIIANYFPSSVINGLLSAIGLILILKQIPHAFGYDKDAEGDFSFLQLDHQNTFSEYFNMIGNIDLGASIIAISSIIILLGWGKVKFLKKSPIPVSLVVVLLGIFLNYLYSFGHSSLSLNPEHLVSVPISTSFSQFFTFFKYPDFSQITNQQVYVVAFTLAIVASLETLLNIEAVDNIDPHKRHTPPNKELIAQGIGNMLSGFIGGLPVTSVIVRSSVAIQSGSRTKMTSLFHGILIAISVYFLPQIINTIPLASLAAILIVTGFKLLNINQMKEMYKKGWNQFLPLIVTILAIVFTDLLVGILIGLAVGVFFILKSNLKNSIHIIEEKIYNEEVTKFIMPQLTTFLHKAHIRELFDNIKPNSNLVLDASSSEYIDYDILDIIKNFAKNNAPDKNINVSLVGFKERYEMHDRIQQIQVMTKEIQEALSPDEALDILKAGNKRFADGCPIERDLNQQLTYIQKNQFPIAAILSCIDSRTSSELIFDLGFGDVFSAKLAGNIVSPEVIASLEFAVKAAGAKLIVVLGHTNCGAIKAACDNVNWGNLPVLMNRINNAIEIENVTTTNRNSDNNEFVYNVTLLNVYNNIQSIINDSKIIEEYLRENNIGIVGGIHNLSTGEIKFTKIYKSEALLMHEVKSESVAQLFN